RTAWARDLSSPSGFDLDGRLLVAVDDRGEVHAFSRSGASVWRQDKLRQRTLSAPLLAARQVIVGDGQGLLHALSRDDGALLARASTDGSKIVGTPVAAANLAVVQTTAGALYAVRAD
ncbi:MAG: PQQ-binding-like beta-propeller repeat protein, partial [Burkholderiales bacterium]|nr:PQQ-binding-like beta-propeller repeat protein [Burkholderiales bacterium]